ncbi:MAG: hypothetical protein ABI868_20885 [Acidobacteriota bacterium]
MAADRKRLVLLGGLAIALAFFGYRAWAPPSGAPILSSSGSASAAAPSSRQKASPPAVAPDVHLEKLEAERPRPGEADRDLFRFRPKPPPRLPAAPPPPVRIETAPVTAPGGPPPPPSLAPITLKFIGLIGPAAEVPKIAVLTDGKGLPVYGKEGDIILGQFKLIRIGAESVDLSYLDGRGRQTIRLSGG